MHFPGDIKKAVFGGMVVLLVCFAQKAEGFADKEHDERSDTLRLNEIEMVGGLEEAKSMVVRENSELIIAEAGADRISVYQVSFDEEDADASGETDSSTDDTEAAEAAEDDHAAPADAVSEERILPDLDKPESLSLILDTEILVVSSGSQQVHWLDHDFGYVRSFTVPSWALEDTEFSPADVTTNEIGEVYVLDRRNRRVFHFNANGSYLQHFRLDDLEDPTRLIYFDESLFITDYKSGTIYIMTDTGRELASIGTFADLERVRVADRRIWVLSGSVLHLFDLSGQHLGNWRVDEPWKKLRDIAVIEQRVFLLTSGSLYYSEFSETKQEN